MSDSTVILALIGVGGTLGGALGGGWLAWWLRQNTEERQWRRQHCLDAYSDVLSACELLSFEADREYGRERGTPDHVQGMEAVLEKVAVMYRAGNRVSLLGSSRLQASCNALTCHCGTVIAKKAFATPKPSAAEWTKVRGDDFARLYGEFLAAARSDLDLKSP